MIDAMSPRRAMLFGALTVGVLDLLDTIVFFGTRGVPPLRPPFIGGDHAASRPFSPRGGTRPPRARAMVVTLWSIMPM